jgi:hypothetical protein
MGKNRADCAKLKGNSVRQQGKILVSHNLPGITPIGTFPASRLSAFAAWHLGHRNLTVLSPHLAFGHPLPEGEGR